MENFGSFSDPNGDRKYGPVPWSRRRCGMLPSGDSASRPAVSSSNCSVAVPSAKPTAKDSLGSDRHVSAGSLPCEFEGWTSSCLPRRQPGATRSAESKGCQDDHTVRQHPFALFGPQADALMVPGACVRPRVWWQQVGAGGRHSCHWACRPRLQSDDDR